MKFKVKNKAKDVRKFRDIYRGKDIFLAPGESAITSTPPVKSDVWEIKTYETEEKKEKIKLTKEVINNDNSSSKRRRVDGDLPNSNIKG